jgi:hypothetical protein
MNSKLIPPCPSNTLKEIVGAYFKGLYEHLPGGSAEYHKILQPK